MHIKVYLPNKLLTFIDLRSQLVYNHILHYHISDIVQRPSPISLFKYLINQIVSSPDH